MPTDDWAERRAAELLECIDGACDDTFGHVDRCHAYCRPAVAAELGRLRRERDEAACPDSHEQAVEALQACFRKHHMDDPSIGWDELSDVMTNALCEVMGDDGFQAWLATLDDEEASDGE